jgi:hypothetical protein
LSLDAMPAVVPPGFTLLSEGRLHTVVRVELCQLILPLLRSWSASSLPPGRRLRGGRGDAVAFDLTSGVSVVLRANRRGGLVRLFNRDLYWGRMRPFEELAASESLRARGVPTVEVVAAAVRRSIPGWHRGAVVTREIQGAMSLWQFLCAAPPADRVRGCGLAAQATRRLHDAGGLHPDLNLQNYLLQQSDGGWRIWIIDCDRVGLTRVTARHRRAALHRLLRSARRLDPEGRIVGPECIAALADVARVDLEPKGTP